MENVELELIVRKTVNQLVDLCKTVKEMNEELHELRMKIYQLETNKKMESFFKGKE